MRPLLLSLLLLAACAATGEPDADDEAGSDLEDAAEAGALMDVAAPPPLPVLASYPDTVITHGPRDRMRIALTFDACSLRKTTGGYDARITKTLIETHTPATLFLGGAWAKEESALVQELAQNPLFELENHTWTHPHLPRLKDDARVLDELARTQSELFALTGRTPRYLRPPYGQTDARITHLAAEAGLATLQFDLASGDPDKHASKERLVSWVLLKARPGSIVVMHINHKRFHTAEALPEIIRGLRKKGYELVTVDALLHDDRPPLCVEAPSDERPATTALALRQASNTPAL